MLLNSYYTILGFVIGKYRLCQFGYFLSTININAPTKFLSHLADAFSRGGRPTILN